MTDIIIYICSNVLRNLIRLLNFLLSVNFAALLSLFYNCNGCMLSVQMKKNLHQAPITRQKLAVCPAIGSA